MKFINISKLNRTSVMLAAGISILVVSGISFGAYRYFYDIAKVETESAKKQAELYAQTGQYAKALDTLKTTIESHKRKNKLTEPLKILFNEYAPKLQEEQRAVNEKKEKAYARYFKEGQNYLSKKQYRYALASFEAARQQIETKEVIAQIDNVNKIALLDKEAYTLKEQLKTDYANGDYGLVAKKSNDIKKYSQTPYYKDLLEIKKNSESVSLKSSKYKQDKYSMYYDQAMEFYRKNPPDLKYAKISLEKALKERNDPSAKKMLNEINAKISNYDNLMDKAATEYQTGKDSRDRKRIKESSELFKKANTVWATDESDYFIRQSEYESSNLKERIAVVDFDESGYIGIPNAGKAVPELLIPYLSKSYEVVERRQMARLLDELSFESSDLIDDSSRRAKFGKMYGVKYIVIGTVGDMGDIFVSTKLVDAQTGVIVKSCNIHAEDSSDLKYKIKDIAKTICMTGDEGEDSRHGYTKKPKFQRNSQYDDEFDRMYQYPEYYDDEEPPYDAEMRMYNVYKSSYGNSAPRYLTDYYDYNEPDYYRQVPIYERIPLIQSIFGKHLAKEKERVPVYERIPVYEITPQPQPVVNVQTNFQTNIQNIITTTNQQQPAQSPVGDQGTTASPSAEPVVEPAKHSTDASTQPQKTNTEQPITEQPKQVEQTPVVEQPIQEQKTLEQTPAGITPEITGQPQPAVETPASTTTSQPQTPIETPATEPVTQPSVIQREEEEKNKPSPSLEPAIEEQKPAEESTITEQPPSNSITPAPEPVSEPEPIQEEQKPVEQPPIQDQSPSEESITEPTPIPEPVIEEPKTTEAPPVVEQPAPIESDPEPVSSPEPVQEEPKPIEPPAVIEQPQQEQQPIEPPVSPEPPAVIEQPQAPPEPPVQTPQSAVQTPQPAQTEEEQKKTGEETKQDGQSEQNQGNGSDQTAPQPAQ